MLPWIVTGVALAGLVVALVAWQVTARRLRETQTRNKRLAEQAQRVAALEAQLAGLTALGQAAFDGMIVVDASHTVIYVNDAAYSMLGRDSQRSSSEPISLIALTRQHELDEIATAVLQGEEDVGWQIVMNGRPYRMRATHTDTEQGRYAALVFEDVTELRRLERARREMVANISHELRTPITSIRLISDTLTRGALSDPKRAARLLAKIAAETDILQQMAQELLDLSMIESGMALMRMVPVELSEIITDAVEHLSEQASRKGLTLEGQLPPHLQVLADAEQVGRVLTNLLHNAIKFTPPGGLIEIAVEPGEEWITVSVTDSGPGIPERERERIFERFYRGDHARVGPGTGLGLAIAKHIVEAHGGRIWVEDAPQLPGARLCFTLPTTEN